jgi:hypothetical protein
MKLHLPIKLLRAVVASLRRSIRTLGTATLALSALSQQNALGDTTITEATNPANVICKPVSSLSYSYEESSTFSINVTDDDDATKSGKGSVSLTSGTLLLMSESSGAFEFTTLTLASGSTVQLGGTNSTIILNNVTGSGTIYMGYMGSGLTVKGSSSLTIDSSISIKIKADTIISTEKGIITINGTVSGPYSALTKTGATTLFSMEHYHFMT